jgi:hypothetical protein
MKTIPAALLACLFLLCPACTTSKLWEDTDPDDPILIAAGKTSEAELKKLGVDYTAVDTADWKGYRVEKSRFRKAIDLHLRLAGTPPALAMDAAGTILALAASEPDFWCEVLEAVACSVSSR